MENVRNIFIDCGANLGNSLDYFINKLGYKYEFYAFEPNCSLNNSINTIISNHPKANIHLINKAIWISDRPQNLYLGHHESSTLLLGKTTKHYNIEIDYSNPQIVQCIDFNSWLGSNFNISDNIIVKMDIEGAEYEVLNSLIQNNRIKYLKKLYIEWHYRFKTLEKDFINSIISKTTELTETIIWD